MVITLNAGASFGCFPRPFKSSMLLPVQTYRYPDRDEYRPMRRNLSRSVGKKEQPERRVRQELCT